MRALDIGRRFIHHYQDNGFQSLPQGSLLDPSVPTTFVGSAGLIQIESAIEQDEERTDEQYVLSQTCFRHFDLEKVGQSPVHLSLFEMLGAFSFGLEEKQDALSKIWHFLTGELGLPKERIWATYFAGGELDGYKFRGDTETAQVWHAIGLPLSRVIGVGIDAGYWVQGDGIAGEYTHKCGASTELFFDLGAELRCSSACEPGCRCGRFIEIANVLFINSQIDQLTQSLKPLSTPFTETVIGAERVAMSLQEKPSVFDIEDIAPLVRLVRSYSQITGSSLSLNGTKGEHVIADHIRALLFLAADGAPEPNKKRGRTRIVRTIIRRIRTYQQVLGITDPHFIPDLLNTALNIYTGQHPDLEKGRERAWAYYRMENERFDRTLSRGFRCFDRLLQQGKNGTFGGKQALYLVKRKGFPLPLIKVMLAQRGIKFDKLAYWSEYAKWERDPRRYWEEHEQSVRP